MASSNYLDLLHNRIDIDRVPFSDRGSRLLVYRQEGQSRLKVALAERLARLSRSYSAYRQRPPFVRDLEFVDEAGQALAWRVETDPHLLRFHTALGDFRLAFQDGQTLAFGLPGQRAAGLRFHVAPQDRQTEAQGGALRAVRDCVYASNRPALTNLIVPDGDGFTVQMIVEPGGDATIVLAIGPDLGTIQEVPPFPATAKAAEARWRGWFDRVPPVAERLRQTYAYAWWVMAVNLLSPQGYIAYEAMTPSKIKYVGLWLWDSALHALAYRHADIDLARNQLRAMLACQLPDGMLPDAIHDEGVVTTIDTPFHGTVTKPPILAWAALKLHEAEPDPAFLREIYWPLVRWNAWWFGLNDDDADGLAQYGHPYSSGLDDNPLWDFDMPAESPDLNTYLAIQMQALAAMAEIMDLPEQAGTWRRRAAALVQRMVEDMWDQEAGLFRALDRHGRPVPVTTPFNLYPLWTGLVPDAMQRRLVGHLADPRSFWGRYALPSVARNDPRFDPATMWRGPVWANVNYFFVEALEQAGERGLAQELRSKTLDLIMAHPSIYEYYHAETGEPPAAAADIYGWTAAVFIDLAIRASREEVGS